MDLATETFWLAIVNQVDGLIVGWVQRNSDELNVLERGAGA